MLVSFFMRGNLCCLNRTIHDSNWVYESYLAWIVAGLWSESLNRDLNPAKLNDLISKNCEGIWVGSVRLETQKSIYLFFFFFRMSIGSIHYLKGPEPFLKPYVSFSYLFIVQNPTLDISKVTWHGGDSTQQQQQQRIFLRRLLVFSPLVRYSYILF